MPRIDPHDDSHPVLGQPARTHRGGALLQAYRPQGTARQCGAVQHPEHPWMLANLDREVVGTPEVQILECKTTGIHGAKLWKDGVPDYVQLQVMHQLAVTGKQAADVAVLIGGQELQVHRIERDEAVIEQLIDLERQFWYFVEPTGHPCRWLGLAEQALRCLFPKDSGQVLDPSQDLELSAVFSDLVALRQKLDQYGEQEAKCKQQIQQRMGDASRPLRGRIGQLEAQPGQRGAGCGTAAKDQPELIQTYGTTRSGSRRFLVQT